MCVCVGGGMFFQNANLLLHGGYGIVWGLGMQKVLFMNALDGH